MTTVGIPFGIIAIIEYSTLGGIASGAYTIGVTLLLFPFHYPLWQLGKMLYPFQENFILATILMLG